MYRPLNSYLLLFLFNFLFIPSQVAQDRTCGTMEYMKKKLDKNEAFQDNRNAIEENLRSAQSSSSRSNNDMITIPTVVHILYNNPQENISDAQVHAQIQVLTEDFRRLNQDASNTPDIFQSIAADIQIEFCLASVDPNGFATSGITRTPTSEQSFGMNDQIKFFTSGGKDAWDTQSYLNIWVGDLGILLGYAQLPGGNELTDGVVVDYRAFGTGGTATSPFHLGRTTTHEVGHWLNLFHIWGDGGCGLDDGVGDTPLASASSSNGAPCTHPAQNTCDEGVGDLPDMFQNYMDYSYDVCMNLFTEGQKIRMRSLFEENNARSSILASKGCDNNGNIATCSDQIQNGNETGVDCGGTSCSNCASLCNDGIKNGNEMMVDCGGDCDSCPPETGQVCNTAIPLALNGTYTALSPSGGMGANNSSATHASWYIFTALADGYINVSSCGGGTDTRLWIYEGDCTNLNNIANEDDNCSSTTTSNLAEEILNVPVTKDKQYYIEWDNRWSSDEFEFSFTHRAIDRCLDGIQNGNETGIDCGGDCIDCDNRCKDGIQNGDEIGIDCGGISCVVCPTTLSFISKNSLTFEDPCQCDNQKNCSANNTLYFHDVMRIPSNGSITSGLDIRVVSSTNFFTIVPCGGTLSKPITGQNGTLFKEVTPGIYELEYWRPSASLPSLSVLESNVTTVIPTSVFEPICKMENCVEEVDIPTLSQWGKMIFMLVVLNMSLIIIRKMETDLV